MKLKMDVYEATNAGLQNEKRHMALELKETKELLTVYEGKTKTLMEDLQATTADLQTNKRAMIGFDEVNREREAKIDELKREIKLSKLKADEFELKLGTLQINHDKMEELLKVAEADREVLTEKLHEMNKARHECENSLQAEVERNR